MNQQLHALHGKRLLATALLAALVSTFAIHPEAHARDRKGQGTEQADQVLFPGATRTPPEQKVSDKLRPTLEKLYKAYEAKDVAKVTELADEAIANPEGNAYSHAFAARLAGVTLLNTDNARARAYLQKAVDFNGLINNEHYESMRLIAQIALGAQDYSGALATIDQLLQETKSQDGDDLAIKGNALYRLKRYPEAIAALKAAVDSNPQPKPEWLELLMGAYFDSNQPAEAARVAEGLAARHPEDKALQLNLASSYMEAGQEDKATALLEKMRAGGQLDKPEDYRNLYAMYINHNKNKEGIAVIQEGMQKGVLPADYTTLNTLAQAYYFSGQTEPAIDAWRKAAPLAPDGGAYLNLAKALFNEGRMAEAKAAAQQALDKGLTHPAEAKKLMGNGK